VATAILRDEPSTLVICRDNGVEEVVSGAHWAFGEGVVNGVRPVVLLDLNEASVRRVEEVLRAAGLRLIADMVVARPRPTIPEPTGLGAVVENARGQTFVRVAHPTDGWMAGRAWQRIGGEINAVRNFDWSDLQPGRVLSEGVST